MQQVDGEDGQNEVSSPPLTQQEICKFATGTKSGYLIGGYKMNSSRFTTDTTNLEET